MQKKILIVEDDVALSNIYSTELKLKGYAIRQVFDGLAAFQVIKEEQPDLVLLDVILPGRNGLDILQEVKTNDDTKALKVVVLTNFGTEENVSKALELGAEDYIMKYNVVPSELPSKVGAILGEASESTVKFVSND